jgi:hypothetical protein
MCLRGVVRACEARRWWRRWRRHWRGCAQGDREGEVQLHRGEGTTDRRSTCSSRSVTLFSMRKMSISSCENIWAMVLHLGRRASVLLRSRCCAARRGRARELRRRRRIGAGHARLRAATAGLPLAVELLVGQGHGCGCRGGRKMRCDARVGGGLDAEMCCAAACRSCGA